MINATDHDVAERVQESLAGKPPIGPRLEVAETAVRREDDWWYVPIVVDDAIERSDEYYALLADVEDELRDRHGINVTLVRELNILRLVANRSGVPTMHVRVSDWERLCGAARLSPNKSAYDADECRAIASAIRVDATIIPFEPPSWSAEVIGFFDTCDGVVVR